MEDLESKLACIRDAPATQGELKLIVRRPAMGTREILPAGQLDIREGLVGDSWLTRRSRHTADGSPHPEMQLTVICTRVMEAVAGKSEGWHLAGDQLYVDLDLSAFNLPAGTRLQIGEARIEITAKPHTGCRKFVDRFGLDAMKFISSQVGQELNLRGVNAKVVHAGRVRVGDLVRKL